MPAQSAHDARGLVSLAISRIETSPPGTYHPGALAHLRASRAQLDAVCALLAELPPTDASLPDSGR